MVANRFNGPSSTGVGWSQIHRNCWKITWCTTTLPLGQWTGSPSTFPLWSLFSKYSYSSLPPTAIIFNIKPLSSPLTHLHFCSETFFWIFIWIKHIFQFCNCLYLKIIIYGFIILCNLFSQFFFIITGSVLFCDRKAISYKINKIFCLCVLKGSF